MKSGNPQFMQEVKIMAEKKEKKIISADSGEAVEKTAKKVTQAAEADALRAVLGGIGMLVDAFDNLIIVGNEVGCDGVRYDDATQAYIRIIGAASCELACRCDTVVECICGQPLVVK